MTYVSFFGNTEILGIQKQAVKVFHHVKHCVKGNFIGHLTPNNTMLRYSHTISMCVLLINKSSIHSDHSNLIFKRACCSYNAFYRISNRMNFLRIQHETNVPLPSPFSCFHTIHDFGI